MTDNEITELNHWEAAWSTRPRLSFPSGLDMGTRNVLRLLKRYLRPGMRYIEVGCAPGKILSWVGRELQAPVCGIDYSPAGVDTARWLCGGLGIDADIRCENAMDSSFDDGGFDLVFSCGLIEHFEDPSPMVMAHLELLAPGGTALVAIPNYGGFYRKLQARCDPENLLIHNLKIMNLESMKTLAPVSEELLVSVFHYGRFSPWLISLAARWGRLGKIISWGLNFAAFLQPVEIRRLCPLIVLQVQRISAVSPEQQSD